MYKLQYLTYQIYNLSNFVRTYIAHMSYNTKTPPTRMWNVMWCIISLLFSQQCHIIHSFLVVTSFTRRLPVRGSESCRDLSISPCLCPVPPWSSMLLCPFSQGPSISTLRRFLSILISATVRNISVSCLLYTCPNHSNLLFLMTIAIGSTFTWSNIS